MSLTPFCVSSLSFLAHSRLTLRLQVNNESSEILRMINSEFNEFAKKPELDLYPQHMRKAIDEVLPLKLPSQ